MFVVHIPVFYCAQCSIQVLVSRILLNVPMGLIMHVVGKVISGMHYLETLVLVVMEFCTASFVQSVLI